MLLKHKLLSISPPNESYLTICDDYYRLGWVVYHSEVRATCRDYKKKHQNKWLERTICLNGTGAIKKLVVHPRGPFLNVYCLIGVTHQLKAGKLDVLLQNVKNILYSHFWFKRK